jgi:acetyl esterase/lipase
MMDIYHTFMHVYNKAFDYGIDTTRICMTGASGGSFLALGAATMLIKNQQIDKLKALFL